MQDYNDSAMIALLPMTTDWCKIDCPHMTLVYAGELKDLKSTTFNELAKDAASIAMLARPIQLKVKGVEVFGEEEKVDVLKLELTPELGAMRHAVERWNASQYKEFKPHATIGPAGTASHLEYIPTALAFNRVLCAWGKDQLVFWMNR